MRIKPNGLCWFGAVMMIFCMGLLAAVCVIMVVKQRYDYLFYIALPMFVFMLFFGGRYICLVCKTVELCHEGYRVSFMGVQRMYPWGSVKIKSIEDCRHIIGRRNVVDYPDCLLLSVHGLRRPDWCEPFFFCALTHPFSTVYACFQPEKESLATYMLGPVECIVIDKKALLDTLQSYGVELDGLSGGK